MGWGPTLSVIFVATFTPVLIQGQISTHPVVIGRLGSPATLTCHSNHVPLRLCLWEQKESDKLIATFDPSNYLDSSAANNGYTFYGEGLDKGSCGIKIGIVQTTDLQRWKCTLLARDNSTAVFRGTVLLQGAETLIPDPSNISSGTAGNQETENFAASMQKTRVQSESRNLGGRPIITAQGSISSAPASTQQNVAPAIQEVEVQSAGLYIVPRRKNRKLVIL